MSIPCKMRPTGTTGLPIGYTRAEYLESTGTQWIDTGYVPNNETGILLDQEKLTAGDFIPMGSRNDNNNTRFYAYRIICGEEPNDSGYGWGKWTAYNKLSGRQTSKLNVMNSRKVEGGGRFLNLPELPFVPEQPIYIFAANIEGKPSLLWEGRIFEAAISQGSEVVHLFVPALDSAGVPCMFDLVSRQPFRNNGTGQFTVGMTLEQVRDLSLPAGGGQLTLSLPHEASFDRLAQKALEQARANGWELTMKYAEVELPAGYIKLDFLESTATQWIDTGYIPNNETGIYLQQLKTTAGDYIAGSYIPIGCSNDDTTHTRFFALRSIADGQFAFTQGAGFGWGSWVDYPVIRGLSKTYTNYMNDRVVVGENEDPIAIEALPFTPTRSLFMFAARVGNGAQHLWGGRIYEAVISQRKSIAMSFVPCISPDGKLGMYDRINGSFHENIGAGSFIAGLATVDDVSNLSLPETGSELTISVPADTPDSAVDQLRQNNPTWQIAIRYRTDNEN